MRSLLLSFFGLGSACAFALTPVKLNDVFSVDKTPGTGKLVYSQGDKTETIELGTESGHYSMGLVFKNSLLPESVTKDLKGDEVVQIVLGTQKGKVQFQIPQFGSATLISRGIDSLRNTYKLTIPNGAPNQDPAIALLLFTSPQTPTEQSDEEKLKGTFFAQSGKLIITPAGKSDTLSVRYQGKMLNFKKQNFTVKLDAALVTPFNSSENSLKGEITFPIYTAKGKAAEALIRKIAGDSLGGMPSAPTQDGISTHNRDVAGSSK